MKCPSCGNDHLIFLEDLPRRPVELFSPCPHCHTKPRSKDQPVPPDEHIPGPCQCNRRSLDDVMAAIYQIFHTSGILTGTEPLSTLGTPLIHPGMFLLRFPVLPPRSLLLLSPLDLGGVAEIAYQQVPELLGIVHRFAGVPGPSDLFGGNASVFQEGCVACGCDVREDVFPSSKGPIVIVKKQASLHIEYPKGINQKVINVEKCIRHTHPDVFIDACAGPGTLGIIAALFGVPHIIFCDIWYASVWSIVQSLYANGKKLGCTRIRMCQDPATPEPVWAGKPVLISEALGDAFDVKVFHGSYEYLEPDLPPGTRLTVFDPFDKASFRKNNSFLAFWHEKVGGEVFIP